MFAKFSSNELHKNTFHDYTRSDRAILREFARSMLLSWREEIPKNKTASSIGHRQFLVLEGCAYSAGEVANVGYFSYQSVKKLKTLEPLRPSRRVSWS